MGGVLADLTPLFEHTIPFRFLSAGERSSLAAQMSRRVYVQGETVLSHGPSRHPEFFFVGRGSVGVYDPEGSELRTNLIPAGSYFGERGVLSMKPIFLISSPKKRPSATLFLQTASCGSFTHPGPLPSPWGVFFRTGRVFLPSSPAFPRK